MATYYLRPSKDVSLEHTCSTGSSGYALINEASPDDDSKYIYHEFTGSSSSGTTETTTSSFTATATIPANHIINSATLVIRAKRGGSSSGDSAIRGSVGTSSLDSTTLSSSYNNYSCNVDVSNLSRSGTTVSATLTAITAIKCYKNDTGYGRITQAYIQVETTASASTYFKQNGSWVQKNMYQKVSGVWKLLTSAPSGFSSGDAIQCIHNPWNFDKTLQRGETLVDDTDSFVTDYIAVTPGVELIVQGCGSSATNTMWLDYTLDKTYHDYWGGSGTSQVVSGKTIYTRTLSASNMANIYYIRVNIAKVVYSYCKVWQNGVLLFDGSLYPYN